jgi:GntR family transcriptional regulator/MocR family aminotransferase
MEGLFELGLQKPRRGARDGARLIHAQLKEAITDGRLPPGLRLPATRQAAAAFGVSRNTAVEVYDRLLHDGYVIARRGSGTFVADRRPSLGGDALRDAPSPHRPLNPFWLRPEVADSVGFWRGDAAPARGAGPAIDFRPALVDSRLFPYDVFRRVAAQQLRALERTPPRYRSAWGNQGNGRLRAAITQHVAVTRAVVCRPEDVIVTSGAQQAFDLLARSLVAAPGAVVAVEDPGYPPMRVAFAAAGARLVPIPVDAQGMVVDALPADTQIVCLCPSHQFPLGVSLSPERRAALLAFARQRGAVIVEDDYDGEFRYAGSPLAALRAGAAGEVFYVGTFSKSMLPALRLGFIIAPAWARPTLVAAKNSLDWHSSTPIQAMVAAFITEGRLTRHVRKMRQIYRRRRAVLLEILARDLAPWLTPIPSLYGMHVAAEARAGLDLEAVAASLARRNIWLHTLRRYYLGPPTRAGLVFGYGVADEQALRQGLAALREALARPNRRSGESRARGLRA